MSKFFYNVSIAVPLRGKLLPITQIIVSSPGTRVAVKFGQNQQAWHCDRSYQ